MNHWPFIKKTLLRSLSVLMLISLYACESSKKMDVQASVYKQHQWTVVLAVSGGIAGWMKNISVDASGNVIINDLKRNENTRKILNNSELKIFSRLVEQLRDVNNATEHENSAIRCKDCFQYKLSIRWQNQQILMSLNDINLSESKANKVVLFLRKAMQK